MKIGFIGLGIMGESMSENIVKKHDDTVYVFDFVKEKVELLVSKGAVACETSVELAEKSDVIISMVPKSEHSRAVYSEILDALDETKTCIDTVSYTHLDVYKRQVPTRSLSMVLGIPIKRISLPIPFA